MYQNICKVKDQVPQACPESSVDTPNTSNGSISSYSDRNQELEEIIASILLNGTFPFIELEADDSAVDL